MPWEEDYEAGCGAAEKAPLWWRDTSLGTQLAWLREHRGISQRQLADTAGLKQSVVSRIERGSDARWSTFVKVYKALSYDPVVLPFRDCDDDAQELLDAERERRAERQEAGLQQNAGPSDAFERFREALGYEKRSISHGSALKEPNYNGKASDGPGTKKAGRSAHSKRRGKRPKRPRKASKRGRSKEAIARS